MKSLSRVVWQEGMHLGPHHFQAQSRYFEDLIDFAASGLGFQTYGLAGCQLDDEAIRNGTVSLVHARGIFPDGLPFDMPGSDALPLVRGINELFPPTRTSLQVLLAITPRRPERMNCALSEADLSKNTRYISEAQPVVDENTGADEKEIRIGRKNIALLLDTEVQEEAITMPLARVMRDGSGHFVYDPNFVPPCLHLVASPRLMTLVRRLIDLLEQKSKSLSTGPTPQFGSASGFSAQEIANAWLMHSVNSALAGLCHLWATKQVHPEKLYSELVRLGGALCTFALDSSPRTLPLYDHGHLGECFESLDQHIRAHLELMVPSNCISIPLRPAGTYLHAGKIVDQRVLDRSRWIFAIRSSAGEVDVISRSPKLVKVCSEEFVPKLVARALPGLRLTHLSAPPAAVSPRADVQYFSIEKAGPCWEHIVKARTIGVYAPGELPDPELQLLIVLDS